MTIDKTRPRKQVLVIYHNVHSLSRKYSAAASGRASNFQPVMATRISLGLALNVRPGESDMAKLAHDCYTRGQGKAKTNYRARSS